MMNDDMEKSGAESLGRDNASESRREQMIHSRASGLGPSRPTESRLNAPVRKRRRIGDTTAQEPAGYGRATAANSSFYEGNTRPYSRTRRPVVGSNSYTRNRYQSRDDNFDSFERSYNASENQRGSRGFGSGSTRSAFFGSEEGYANRRDYSTSRFNAHDDELGGGARRDGYNQRPAGRYPQRGQYVGNRPGGNYRAAGAPQDRRGYSRVGNGTSRPTNGGTPYNNRRRLGDMNGGYAPNGSRFANNARGPQKRTFKTKMPIKPVKFEEKADPTAPIRLNKYIANSGICSRREADSLIESGQITVNGVITTELGTRVTRQDEILYKDKKISIESKIYVLLNKPKNCVTTSDDPECRQTVLDFVKDACEERIYPVGRLDRNTTGVLLLTNDGDLAAKLTHPAFMKKKIYHVWLNKNVVPEDMQKIADGIELEDGEIHADALSYVTEDDMKQVGIEIHSGRNRIVRRIFEHLGYKVVKLDRVYFAGLTKKNLSRGRWRYLNEQEVNALRMGAFE